MTADERDPSFSYRILLIFTDLSTLNGFMHSCKGNRKVNLSQKAKSKHHPELFKT